VVCGVRWFTEFTRIHYELEPENLRRGLPLERHVDLVNERLEKGKRWYDNALLVILFWPIYLLFFKKSFLSDFARGLRGINNG
jgi:hypothetical protein